MDDGGQFAALARDFGQVANEAGPIARAAVRKTTLDIQADAQVLVPVDTGNLRSSISVAFRGNAAYAEGIVGPTASYGVFVELGTSRMAAQPYMGPAFDRRAPVLEQVMAQIVDRFG